MDKKTMKKLYDALHLGHSMALKIAAEYHKEFEGKYPATHKILDDQVQQIREAITVAEHSLSAQDEVLTLHADKLLGLMVSMDVSTCDADAADRIFGKVIAMMPTEDGIVILAEEESRNCAAAAPSPAVAVEPVAQEFASYIIKNHPKWHKDWACKRCAPESEILKDGFSCTLHKAHDALGDAKCKACEGMGRIATDDGFPGDAMSHRAPEPPTMERCPDCDGKGYFPATPSPSLAVREPKPNADCSGEPANCPDNEGYGCACDPMNKAAMREQQHADQG